MLQIMYIHAIHNNNYGSSCVEKEMQTTFTGTGTLNITLCYHYHTIVLKSMM